MPARHDLKKRHHGRRKLGSRKRKLAWMRLNNKKMRRRFVSKRRTRRQLWLRRQKYRGH